MHKIEYFTVDQEGKTIVLRMVCPELSERLIINGFQEALLSLIKQRQPALLLLDYANVRFSSSETINALIKDYEWLTAQGGLMKFFGMRPEVRRKFQICKLEGRLFHIFRHGG